MIVTLLTEFVKQKKHALLTSSVKERGTYWDWEAAPADSPPFAWSFVDFPCPFQ
jgi:hypothetical protein